MRCIIVEHNKVAYTIGIYLALWPCLNGYLKVYIGFPLLSISISCWLTTELFADGDHCPIKQFKYRKQQLNARETWR